VAAGLFSIDWQAKVSTHEPKERLVSTDGKPKEKLARSELAQTQKASEREGSFDMFGMLAGNVPPGGRALVITRWNEDKNKVASVRNAYEALGIDVVDEPSPTIENVQPEQRAEAAIYPSRWMSEKISLIALAHMLALKKASEFKEDWTLILEEDARPLPIGTDKWIKGFKSAWERLRDRDVAMVRLGWCGGSNSEVEDVGDGFQLVQNAIDHGVCTTGYIVNKHYIPRILQTFPVKKPVDLVWQKTLFQDPELKDKIYSITRKGAEEMYAGWTNPDINQHGIIAQNRRDNPSPQ
jgi:hypothetical protein